MGENRGEDGWEGGNRCNSCVHPPPDHSQSQLGSAGCCYDTTQEMTLELNKSCNTSTHSGKSFVFQEQFNLGLISTSSPLVLF